MCRPCMAMHLKIIRQCRILIDSTADGTVRQGDPSRKGSVLIQSVDRSVRILLTLQGARRLSLADLAARVQLPASTVHGILATLAAHGMVEQEAGSSRYMLGPAVVRLSTVYLDSLEFRSRALK